jgi:tRNA-Thr(GGU) m(6)t(6)A37 methyltransferase TsaA
MNMLYVKPIGLIRSEHKKAEDTPIQPVYAEECVGTVEILPEYEEGLTDIEGFSHIILINWLHKSGTCKMLVKPFLEDAEHGVFATRSPCRPNPVGLSIVRLIKRVGLVLSIQGVDILDGTPVLDIKPYSGLFDCFPDARNGWQEVVSSKEAAWRGKRGYRGSAGKEKNS